MTKPDFGGWLRHDRADGGAENHSQPSIEPDELTLVADHVYFFALLEVDRISAVMQTPSQQIEVLKAIKRKLAVFQQRRSGSADDRQTAIAELNAAADLLKVEQLKEQIEIYQAWRAGIWRAGVGSTVEVAGTALAAAQSALSALRAGLPQMAQVAQIAAPTQAKAEP
jgi:hypothetical protein